MAERRHLAWRRFLLWCSRTCGCCRPPDQAAVRNSRRARKTCAQLRKDLGQGSSGSVPDEHIRAAEQHLVALERWLLGQKPDEVDDLKRLLAELGSIGPAHEEDAETFTGLFGAPSTEVLVKAWPCLARLGSLNYSGKLYMSNQRLCFRASMLGFVPSFSCAWKDVSEVSLLTQTSVMLYPVQVSLKNPQQFSKTSVDQLLLFLFDLECLNHFDKVAAFFTETRLFDFPQDADDDDAGEASAPVAPETGMSRQKTPERTSFLQQPCMVWELQRRVSVWSKDWHAPFLPHDGHKKYKWMLFSEKGYTPHPSLVPGTSANDVASPPITVAKLQGEKDACTWQAVVDINTDPDGWQYAVDFYTGPEHWTPQLGHFSHVRRRRWQPAAGTPDRHKHLCKLDTTLIANRGLNPVQHEVLDCEIGDVSLEALGQALESDAWTERGELMALYFEEFRASDLDMHDWTTLEGVKGKIRSVECRMAVPPAPMCPKETRCNSTWHVSVDPGKVVLESVSMSLDVPYGTSFNVVVCDTFTRAEGGDATRMVRSCAIEWVSSIWLKSLVEENVPPQTRDLGERWAAVLRRWGSGDSSESSTEPQAPAATPASRPSSRPTTPSAA